MSLIDHYDSIDNAMEISSEDKILKQLEQINNNLARIQTDINSLQASDDKIKAYFKSLNILRDTLIEIEKTRAAQKNQNLRELAIMNSLFQYSTHRRQLEGKCVKRSPTYTKIAETYTTFNQIINSMKLLVSEDNLQSAGLCELPLITETNPTSDNTDHLETTSDLKLSH